MRKLYLFVPLLFIVTGLLSILAQAGVDSVLWSIDPSGVCRDDNDKYPRWSDYNWTLSQCETACKKNRNCQGFAMHKKKNYCQLFGSDGENKASQPGTEITRGDSSQPEYICYLKQNIDTALWSLDSSGVCRDDNGKYPRWSDYNWTLSQCETACRKNSNCQGFAMHKKKNYCQLFGSDGENKASQPGTEITRGDSSHPEYICYFSKMRSRPSGSFHFGTGSCDDKHVATANGKLMSGWFQLASLGNAALLIVTQDDCGNPNYQCPPGYKLQGQFHTAPGSCDGRNEGVQYDGNLTDSGWMGLCALPETALLVITGDDCGNPTYKCPPGYSRRVQFHTSGGGCDGKNEGIQYDGNVTDSGWMTLCSKQILDGDGCPRGDYASLFVRSTDGCGYIGGAAATTGGRHLLEGCEAW